MDKLVADGRRVTISNDGATIMRLLEIEHPAAKTLVDISMSQVRFCITCVALRVFFVYLLLNIPSLPSTQQSYKHLQTHQ